MERIDFINNTTPALNATNLNKLQQNIEDEFDNKLDKSSVKTETSLSDVDTYSCNYIDSIVESGSNANGNYIKYKNGTMICWVKIEGNTFNCSQSGGTNRYYYVDTNSSAENTIRWNYPEEFISEPVVNVSVGSSAFTMASMSIVNQQYCTANCCLPYAVTSVTFRWYLTAIGRWKGY